MKLNDDDIKKIEEFMHDENFQTVDYFLSCYKRLKQFALITKDELDILNRYGDLD